MAQQQNKTQPTEVDVSEFFASIENEQLRKDSEALCQIMMEVTKLSPVMWGPSIVGFGSQHYKYASGREGDMGLIGFSPRKAGPVVYLTDGVEDYRDLLSKLGPHKTGKVCLYLKRLSDVDSSVLREIIKRSYEQALPNAT